MVMRGIAGKSGANSVKKTFHVSGRTELAGNHTDHQKGRILASTIQMGLSARVEPGAGSLIRVKSQGFGPREVNLNQLSVRPREFGSPEALVRGVAASFKELGLKIGGFDAEIRSSLPVGAGLSSSAGGFGANGLGGVNDSAVAGLVVEVFLTFVFVLTILGVTSKPEFSNVAGIVIGLTLTLVHIFGIHFTGTSVNPARSFASAIFAGGAALSNVWVFIVAPLVGGALAALVWKFLSEGKK